MLAQKGMTWMATFKIKNNKRVVTHAINGHIGKEISSWIRALAATYMVKKSDVVLVERWQEPKKKV